MIKLSPPSLFQRNKIALIGAGNIGGTLALLAVLRGLGDVVLYDVVDGLPQGKALDLTHMCPVFGLDAVVTGSNDIASIKDADICVVTSGIARKPGMSRDDLVKTNAEIISQVAHGIRNFAPNSLVIVITNPLDSMAYLMQRETGFSPSKVVGMAGVLDTARYQSLLGLETGISKQSISAFVLGGHGDEMVPVRSYTSCGGLPVEKVLSSEDLARIEKRVRGSGGEVVNLLKSGSAFYSPAASAIAMVESYLYDERRVLPMAAQLNGEYGLQGIYLGVPVVFGRNGVEQILEIDLSPSEMEALKVSAGKVKEIIDLLH
jgi:malate dehydrogenase